MAQRGLFIAGIAALLLHAALLIWLAPAHVERVLRPTPWHARVLTDSVPVASDVFSPEPSSPAQPPVEKTVFFDTADVDRPAQPLEDWFITMQGLPVQKLYRAHVELWIDAKGTIVRQQIHQLQPDDAQGRAALHALTTTPMQVAVKQGQLVGNRRNVEIFFGKD